MTVEENNTGITEKQSLDETETTNIQEVLKPKKKKNKNQLPHD